VNVETAMEAFRSFLNEFTFTGSQEPYYLHKLQQIHEAGQSNLNIDCGNLSAFAATRTLYSQLVHYPQEVVPIMDLVVHQELTSLFGEPQSQRRVQVRTFNLKEVRPMRDLNPTEIDQLVSLKGMVSRCSHTIPDLKQAFFRCLVCSVTQEVMIDRGRIEEPTSCPGCNVKHSMELLHNRSLFSDKQLIRLQESPESIPEGETPHTITLLAYDDLVDSVRPGDRLEVTGIFRAHPLRTSARKTSVRAVYRTYLDVIHFRSSAKRDQNEDEDPVADTTEVWFPNTTPQSVD
jgi:DNA replication licensing factor MCM4